LKYCSSNMHFHFLVWLWVKFYTLADRLSSKFTLSFVVLKYMARLKYFCSILWSMVRASRVGDQKTWFLGCESSVLKSRPWLLPALGMLTIIQRLSFGQLKNHQPILSYEPGFNHYRTFNNTRLVGAFHNIFCFVLLTQINGAQ
jgi:hypothetical protein